MNPRVLVSARLDLRIRERFFVVSKKSLRYPPNESFGLPRGSDDPNHIYCFRKRTQPFHSPEGIYEADVPMLLYVLQPPRDLSIRYDSMFDTRIFDDLGVDTLQKTLSYLSDTDTPPVVEGQNRFHWIAPRANLKDTVAINPRHRFAPIGLQLFIWKYPLEMFR